MLKHVQISPHRNRSDSVSLRSTTSCASSLCGSPEPPNESMRSVSRASSYCSLNETMPQVIKHKVFLFFVYFYWCFALQILLHVIELVTVFIIFFSFFVFHMCLCNCDFIIAYQHISKTNVNLNIDEWAKATIESWFDHTLALFTWIILCLMLVSADIIHIGQYYTHCCKAFHFNINILNWYNLMWLDYIAFCLIKQTQKTDISVTKYPSVDYS